MVSSCRSPLPFLLLVAATLSACSGKGEKKETNFSEVSPGISGSLCLTADDTYTVTDASSGASQNFTVAVDPLFARFRGGMGGQIRAIATLDTTAADGSIVPLLAWGSGSAIRYGTITGTGGIVPLSHRGVVTDLAITFDKRIFFSTERGIGLMDVSGSSLAEEAMAYRSFPSGVAAIATGAAGELYVVTGEGYLLTTSLDKLASGEKCFDILTSKSAMIGDDNTMRYRPFAVRVTAKVAVVLGDRRPAGLNLTPNFNDAFAPLCQSFVEGKTASAVRVVDLPSHRVGKVVADTADGSFTSSNRFVPTDATIDGENLYVAGLVSDQTAINQFIASTCSAGDLAAQTTCVCQAAVDGRLTSVQSAAGASAITAGFFIYRNLSDLTKAAHFEKVPVTTALFAANNPPLQFRIVANQDRLYLRAPNFLMRLSKSADAMSQVESWSFDKIFDTSSGLIPGLPLGLALFSGPSASGVVSAVTAVRGSDRIGASALDAFGDDGSFINLDTGSTLTRIEDAAGQAATPTIAEIDVIDSNGGALSLATPTARSHIAIAASANARVAAASYNGSRLAFAWTEPATTAQPAPAWRLDIQRGDDDTSRGELVISRQGGSNQYDGFPSLVGLTPEAGARARGLADITLRDSSLFVLLEGFADGTWYNQVGVYAYGDDHRAILVGITNTMQATGPQTFTGGKFVRITKSGTSYTVYFTAADGLHRLTMVPGTTTARATGTIETGFLDSSFVNLTCDVAGGNTCAAVSGTSVQLRSITDLTRTLASLPIAVTSGAGNRFDQASLVATGSRLFLALPNGATAPFTTIDMSNAAAPTIASSCTTCDFNAVAAFPNLPDRLLVSSPTGGVEIYDISGL